MDKVIMQCGQRGCKFESVTEPSHCPVCCNPFVAVLAEQKPLERKEFVMCQRCLGSGRVLSGDFICTECDGAGEVLSGDHIPMVHP